MSTDIVRIYPIRTTRQNWDIPLYCYHKCSENKCSKQLVRSQGDAEILYQFIDNPNYIDGKCQRSEKLERTSIILKDFQYDNPDGEYGPLYDPEMIVIPDNTFQVLIDFPINNPIEVTLKSFSGFTLKELLSSISTIYKHIYEQELVTSTFHDYHIKKPCVDCSDLDILNFINLVKNPKEKECCICYSKYNKNEEVSQLNCNHIFHTHCLLHWLETKPTCPLCRNTIVSCENCDEGYKHLIYRGVVIPHCFRDSPYRNTTDGIFGIWGYDLEDLSISKLHYNRIEKRLYIHIKTPF
jgi:hypothetical protein